MFQSHLTTISQLEADIAFLEDLHANKDRQPEDVLAPGVRLDGFFTHSQTRRLVRMVMAKQEQIRLLKKEIAAFERSAVLCEITYTDEELTTDDDTVFDLRVYDIAV